MELFSKMSDTVISLFTDVIKVTIIRVYGTCESVMMLGQSVNPFHMGYQFISS